jgi:hexosaminidase
MDDDSKIQMNLPQKNEQGKKEDVLSDVYWGQGKNYSNPILIKSSNTILSSSYKGKEQISNTIEQNFIFNKATGKKISINNAPSKSYPGDGAFTLVNGVQNKKGLAKSSEFLGFLSGCEAIIDMGNTSPYNQVVVHALRQEGSWIWQPLTVTVFTSQDGVNYTSMGLTDDFVVSSNSNGTMTVKFGNTSNRFIKVQIENWGTIPSGKPGASNTAWLFVDEIEVN